MGAGKLRIGGACGFWGETDMALPQFLAEGDVDVVIFDYLAEITLSIMARARAKDPAAGFATDFPAVLAPHLTAIAEQGMRIVSNAGGLNPGACAEALRGLIAEAGLDLSVAVVTGDDLTGRATEFAEMREMFSGDPFPPVESVASINAYLGAFPIAAALAEGADIVITGRTVDSALALGPAIHAFGWARTDWDALAGGSLAGHILECGPQATGGNFTDWAEIAPTLVDIGYPIAELVPDGSFQLSKPAGTGGLVSRETVAEQMLYEVGDPASYVLPDVVCDLSDVTIAEEAPGVVRVAGARGRPGPSTYKVSATYADGWRISMPWFLAGADAEAKARLFAEVALQRARAKLRARNLAGYGEVWVETFGDPAGQIALILAARHAEPQALTLLLKEATGFALAAPPGLASYGGLRPRPSPVVRLFSFLLPKDAVPVDGKPVASAAPVPEQARPTIDAPKAAEIADPVSVPLHRIAVARSGDKGDIANIGVVPRDPASAPCLWAALTEEAVAAHFADRIDGPVARHFLPGTGAINLVLHGALGGGGMASLRLDPQGKTYAQILLAMPVTVPRALLEEQ
ncbi:MAG: acyclic terpene utilization AtuA family protein [Pseudomonadota bacterium]